MPMLYAISAQENVNVNPNLLETHMYAASRCTGVQEVVALMPCVRMVNSAPVSQAMVLTLSLGANQCPDVSGNVDSMHIVTHRTGSACADLDTWEMPMSDVDTQIRACHLSREDPEITDLLKVLATVVS